MHDQLAGYIAGPVNAEDLVVAPGGEWVLTSGMTGPTAPLGRLYAVRVEDGACSEIFPYGAARALDSLRFADQSELDPLKFRPHGIDVALRRDGRTELYVVGEDPEPAVATMLAARAGGDLAGGDPGIPGLPGDDDSPQPAQ